MNTPANFRHGILASIVVLLLAGCGTATDGEKTASAERANRVVIGMPWEPRTLNPFRGVDSASYFAQSLIHGGLVTYNERGEIGPGLAERFLISPDGKTYTFFLRKSLKFSDGTPLTADDVIASINATIGPGSPFRNNYECINSCASPAPLQVVLHLSSKNLPLMLRMADLRIVPASSFSEKMKNSNILARKPVGCGPFVLHRWDPGFELVFKANPYYWGEKARSDYLVWRIIPDGNLLSAALFRGDVDVARVDGRIELGVLSEHSDVEFKKFPGNRTIFLAFNTEKEPYAKPAFRQAISMLIDKYAIVNSLYAGFAVVPGSDFPEYGPVYNRLSRRWPYDTKLAAQSLEASGFEMRADGWYEKPQNKPLSTVSEKTQEKHVLAGAGKLQGKPVSAAAEEPQHKPVSTAAEEPQHKPVPAAAEEPQHKPVPTVPAKQTRLAFKIVTIKDFMDVAQVVAGDLQTAKIGVRVELVEYSTMKDKYLTTGEYDAVLFSRTQGPDPDCRLVWSKNGPLNYARYKNDRLDGLLEDAYKAPTEAERKRLYDQVQTLLSEQLPWVYLVQPSLTIAHKTYISGIGDGVTSDTGLPWDNPLFDAAHWKRVEP